MAVPLRLWKLNEDSVAGVMNDCTLWQFAVNLAGGFVEMPGVADESLNLFSHSFSFILNR